MRFVFVFLIVCCVGNSNAQSYYIHTIDSLAAEIESKVGLSVLKEVWGGINNDSTHNIYFVDSANRVHKMTLSRSLD